MRAVALLKDKPRALPTAAFEMVTPSQAQLWLDNQASNRRINKANLKRLTTTAARGDILPIDQGISFNDRGQLINGQHRLMALVASGKSALLLVVRGLSDRAQLVMDQGAKRMAHEQIALSEGFPVTATHVATAKEMVLSVGGLTNQKKEFNREALTDIQLVDRYYVKHRQAIEFAIGDHRVSGHASIRGITIAPVFAPIARAYYREDRELLKRFLHILILGTSEDGEVSGKDTAAVVLRNYLLQGRDKNLSSHSRDSRRIIYKKTEVALRAFLKGEHIQRLGQMTTEVELFPLPDEAKESTKLKKAK